MSSFKRALEYKINWIKSDFTRYSDAYKRMRYHPEDKRCFKCGKQYVACELMALGSVSSADTGECFGNKTFCQNCAEELVAADENGKAAS